MILPCNKLSKFSVKGDKAGLCALDERQLVNHVREPLTLFLPTDVEAKECVLQGLVAHADLCGERLFAQVHQGTADGEVFVDLVIEVQAEHGLSLHSVGVVALY